MVWACTQSGLQEYDTTDIEANRKTFQDFEALVWVQVWGGDLDLDPGRGIGLIIRILARFDCGRVGRGGGRVGINLLPG